MIIKEDLACRAARKRRRRVAAADAQRGTGLVQLAIRRPHCAEPALRIEDLTAEAHRAKYLDRRKGQTGVGRSALVAAQPGTLLVHSKHQVLPALDEAAATAPFEQWVKQDCSCVSRCA